MKNSVKLLIAILIALVFFSVFSGCKSKQKMVKNSQLIDKTVTTGTDSTRLIAQEHLREQKLDTSKFAQGSVDLKSQKRTVELRFTLDSNKTISPADTAGNFDLAKLINMALKNASALVIKVEDQQSQSSSKSKSGQRGKSEVKNQTSFKDSSAVKKSLEKKDLQKNENEIHKIKDSTVATNAGGSFTLICICAAAVVILLLWIYKR